MFQGNLLKILIVAVIFLLVVYFLGPDKMEIIPILLFLSMIFGAMVNNKSFSRKIGWISLNSVIMILILVSVASFFFFSDPDLQKYRSCLESKSGNGFCAPPGVGAITTLPEFIKSMIVLSVVLLVAACIFGITGIGIRRVAHITGKKVKI